MRLNRKPSVQLTQAFLMIRKHNCFARVLYIGSWSLQKEREGISHDFQKSHWSKPTAHYLSVKDAFLVQSKSLAEKFRITSFWHNCFIERVL